MSFLSPNRRLTARTVRTVRTASGALTAPAQVSEPHPATSTLIIAERQGSHTSFFAIYLNEILDEQKGLTASKWDWIEEEMY